MKYKELCECEIIFVVCGIEDLLINEERLNNNIFENVVFYELVCKGLLLVNGYVERVLFNGFYVERVEWEGF